MNSVLTKSHPDPLTQGSGTWPAAAAGGLSLTRQEHTVFFTAPDSIPTTPGDEVEVLEFSLLHTGAIHVPKPEPAAQIDHRLRGPELESPPTPNSLVDEPVGEMTLHNPPKNVYRVWAAALWFFLGGLDDGAPGALLPSMEEYYSVLYLVVSLIWAGNALGFITTAVILPPLQRKIGRFWIMVLGVWGQVVGNALVSASAPFPVTVLGFYTLGLGYAMVLSQLNVMLSRMENASVYLGYLYGMYGLGGTVSPLIAQQMLNHGLKWLRFYLIAVGVGVACLASIWAAFSGCDEDLRPWDHQPGEPHESEEIPLRDVAPARAGLATDHEASTVRTHTRSGAVAEALRDPKTWLIALFTFFYQGGEVAIGGWIVTFLLDYRHANPETTLYVASGFWFGLMVGRMAVTHPVARTVGSRRGIILLGLSLIVLIALGWVIPSLVAVAVLVAVAGVCIGPLYPLQVTVATRHLTRRIQVISLTIATAFGSSGGALFPFLVGLVSQFAGTYVVMPFFIALFLAMLACWMLLPNIDRNVKTKWWHHVW